MGAASSLLELALAASRNLFRLLPFHFHASLCLRHRYRTQRVALGQNRIRVSTKCTGPASEDKEGPRTERSSGPRRNAPAQIKKTEARPEKKQRIRAEPRRNAPALLLLPASAVVNCCSPLQTLPPLPGARPAHAGLANALVHCRKLGSVPAHAGLAIALVDCRRLGLMPAKRGWRVLLADAGLRPASN